MWKFLLLLAAVGTLPTASVGHPCNSTLLPVPRDGAKICFMSPQGTTQVWYCKMHCNAPLEYSNHHEDMYECGAHTAWLWMVRVMRPNGMPVFISGSVGDCSSGFLLLPVVTVGGLVITAGQPLDTQAIIDEMKDQLEQIGLCNYNSPCLICQITVEMENAFSQSLPDAQQHGCLEGENVALDKPAFQTSTALNLGAASNAVDGNTDTDYFAGSCASTLEDSNPAWWVDLGETHIIDRVDIFNRQDCCGDKISPFNIHIGDSPRVSENHKCGGDHNMDPHQPATSVSCYGMKGRYVGIRLPGSFRTLTLCEVQISGEPDDCASSPCVHGTCFDAIDGYSCFCEPGWGGTNCDTNTDDCRSSPCGEHGTCNDVVGGYTCTCDAGWEGINCDQDINECESSPCVHGYCSDGVNSYTCICEQNWSGTNCDQGRYLP
ncbi:neurogenic locus notch homolog protein 1-like [Branchiostoma floridae]|uniref:Neurogenic locus notch homolog protein 1-like n=1 Tax=Branchiostoma floridae TaxID=7739 RepID=A0A9J7M717_BRAFL|nr:neurogenic locus notch homolog protein 1-like [Branchiostoma floridae]